MTDRGIRLVVVHGSDGRVRKVEQRREAQGLRDTARARWVQAPTDLKRWAVAFDYARAAAAAAGRRGLDTSGEIERAMRALWGLGDAFTAWIADQEAGDG